MSTSSKSKNHKRKANQAEATQTPAPGGPGSLQDDELGEVTGGTAAPVGAVVTPPSVESPRDAASGLPTGKRQHKPF